MERESIYPEIKKVSELRYAPLASDVWKALGDLKRTGWINRGVANPESVQEHTLALIKIVESIDSLSAEEKQDLQNMLEVHDWPEAIHGDEVIFTYDDEKRKSLKEIKFEKEKAALASICERLGEKGNEIMSLWLRFENSSDDLASLARQIDKYQAIEKALEYEKTQGIPMFQEFLDYARKSVNHPVLLGMIKKLEESK